MLLTQISLGNMSFSTSRSFRTELISCTVLMPTLHRFMTLTVLETKATPIPNERLTSRIDLVHTSYAVLYYRLYAVFKNMHSIDTPCIYDECRMQKMFENFLTCNVQ